LLHHILNAFCYISEEQRIRKTSLLTNPVTTGECQKVMGSLTPNVNAKIKCIISLSSSKHASVKQRARKPNTNTPHLVSQADLG